MRNKGCAAFAAIAVLCLAAPSAFGQSQPAADAVDIAPTPPPTRNSTSGVARRLGLSSNVRRVVVRRRPKTPSAIGITDSARGVARKQGLTPRVTTNPTIGPFIVAPGIAMTLNYTEESAGNPVGGIRQGAAYTGQAFFGLDFDGKTLANIDGASGHLILTQRHGNSLSADYIGNNTSVQELFGTQNFHLAQLTYEQKLLNDRVDFEIGRTVANVQFLASPIYCQFQSNSICGNPTFIFKNSNFTYFPASSYGSHVRVALTDKYFFHIGAYEQNPQNKLPTDNGFNFSVDKATGAVIPFELGYATDFTNDRLPRHYGIGGYYDASRYTDPFLDSFGKPAVLSGQPYANHFGRSGFYARFDQMIYRPNSDSPRGLTVFGVFMQNVSGVTQEDQFFALGLLKTGTFAGRDADAIGFLVDDQRFSKSFLSNIAAARVSIGGTNQIPRDQVMMELNYGYQANPYVRITPNLQAIINPDQSSVPFRRTNIPNAFVIGCKATVDISSLMNYAFVRR